MTDDSPDRPLGGRPPFEPNDEQRRVVRAMAAYGIPHLDIARVIGVSDVTLRKHFRRELDIAAPEANAKVAHTLFKKATEDGDTTAMIFWLKVRAGWSDKTVIEQTGPNGGPILTETTVRHDLTGLTADELETMQRLLEKAEAGAGPVH